MVAGSSVWVLSIQAVSVQVQGMVMAAQLVVLAVHVSARGPSQLSWRCVQSRSLATLAPASPSLFLALPSQRRPLRSGSPLLRRPFECGCDPSRSHGPPAPRGAMACRGLRRMPRRSVAEVRSGT
ncbi:hypothetical protein B0H10DRAFT_2328486 [Mycena sp. CBHHK59/15]|nr:hypothetical protein B0H10DRAFT_2328486 [Mycena sp. CBHHK59/15]